ncbi:hypothetical protein G6O69_21210 [Pseudenhygromyxa sp. WMMC2535]|uniref:multiheme c-type cytochrome n=1 Tax=Pseudenhygromyxa sp. WMMC2535 TaxID=2712867 RepID=UPI001554B9DB|nr:multiheme c-type cytochrome [Pseudenhygromyxa sp. WMMC2535]NVB40372.1 hypothetical protein [Pseudenhygromyxa sp. WMMC2535]
MLGLRFDFGAAQEPGVELGMGVAEARSRRAATMPGPTTAERDDDRLTSQAGCETCHADIAEEWSRSLHHASHDDPMFQEALSRESKPAFCRGCHVPEADPRAEADPRRAALGVGCVGCHLIPGEDGLLAGPGVDEPSMPHALRREPGFATSQACAGCHEFAFPSRGREGVGLLMQRTISEHARSPRRHEPCQGCHMPPTVGVGGAVHRSHDFRVVDEPRMFAAAATISAARVELESGAERVSVELRPRALGHDFPTGDLFRRLAVRVEGPGWSEERYLARRFAMQRMRSGATVKIEVGDDRVDAGDLAEVQVVVPDALRGVELRWRVLYQRVLESSPGAPHRAEVWDERELAGGVLCRAH